MTDPVADDDALVEDLRNSGTYAERIDVLHDRLNTGEES